MCSGKRIRMELVSFIEEMQEVLDLLWRRKMERRKMLLLRNRIQVKENKRILKCHCHYRLNNDVNLSSFIPRSLSLSQPQIPSLFMCILHFLPFFIVSLFISFHFLPPFLLFISHLLFSHFIHSFILSSRHQIRFLSQRTLRTRQTILARSLPKSFWVNRNTLRRVIRLVNTDESIS
jgi:hypothetical protein